MEKVLEACPNIYWRLLVALARFGGLRIPSEPFSLRWLHVAFVKNQLTVPSPKTETSAKAFRVIPINKALRPYLEEARQLAPEGADYIFPEQWRKKAQGPNGWINCNLRTQFERIIQKAGLEGWPKLFQNLRSSFESDLAAVFPLGVVTKILGNTPSVALRHYIDPTEAAFQQMIDWQPPRKGADSSAAKAQKAALQEGCRKSGVVQDFPQPFADYQVTHPLAQVRSMMHNCQVGGARFERATSTV